MPPITCHFKFVVGLLHISPDRVGTFFFSSFSLFDSWGVGEGDKCTLAQILQRLQCGTPVFCNEVLLPVEMLPGTQNLATSFHHFLKFLI